jgi:hypothetical protein
MMDIPRLLIFLQIRLLPPQHLGLHQILALCDLHSTQHMPDGRLPPFTKIPLHLTRLLPLAKLQRHPLSFS